MASFVSILRKVGHVLLGIEQVAEPFVEAAYPVSIPVFRMIDGWAGRLQSAIVTVEASNPTPGQGASKAPLVMADFDAGLAFTQQVLALEGKKLTYDAAKLQEAIKEQVAAFNAMADVKASFKIVPIS